MKVFAMIFLLLSCGSIDEKKAPQSVKKKATTTLQPKNKTVERQSALAYNLNSESLKGKTRFYRETYDSLTSIPNSSDEISTKLFLCRQGKVSQGILELSKVGRKYSKWPSFWNALGICYLKKNAFYEGRVFFERALSLNSSYSPAYNNLGLIATKIDYWYSAEDFFKKSIRFNPSSEVSQFNLGRLYLAHGLGAKARSHFTKISDTQFYKAHVLKLLAIAHIQAGSYQQGVNLLKGQSGLSSEQKMFNAFALAKLGRKAEAKALIGNMSLQKSHPSYALLQDTKRFL